MILKSRAYLTLVSDEAAVVYQRSAQVAQSSRFETFRSLKKQLLNWDAKKLSVSLSSVHRPRPGYLEKRFIANIWLPFRYGFQIRIRTICWVNIEIGILINLTSQGKPISFISRLYEMKDCQRFQWGIDFIGIVISVGFNPFRGEQYWKGWCEVFIRVPAHWYFR